MWGLCIQEVLGHLAAAPSAVSEKDELSVAFRMLEEEERDRPQSRTHQ
jgi:hypothetical protein